MNDQLPRRQRSNLNRDKIKLKLNFSTKISCHADSENPLKIMHSLYRKHSDIVRKKGSQFLIEYLILLKKG